MLPKNKGKRNMARTKMIVSIDSEIAATQEKLVKARAKYDAIAQNLKELMEKKKGYQARAIMEAFIKSGKSHNELVNFLNVNGR